MRLSGKLNRFGNAAFHPKTSGIIANEQLHGQLEIVTDQKSRLLPAVAAQDHLAQDTIITAQFNKRIMNHEIGILALIMFDLDLFPGLKLYCFFNQYWAPAALGDKFYPLQVELL